MRRIEASRSTRQQRPVLPYSETFTPKYGTKSSWRPVEEIQRLLEFLGADSSEEVASRCVEKTAIPGTRLRQVLPDV